LSTVAPDRRKIHKPVDAGERHFLLPATKNAYVPGFRRQPAAATIHSEIGRRRNNSVVSATYMRQQTDAARPDIRDRGAANLAAFTSAFVRSLLRFAAFAI
jgi:hypothetical protein